MAAFEGRAQIPSMRVNVLFPSPSPFWFSSISVVVPIPAVAENAVLTFAELQVRHRLCMFKIVVVRRVKIVSWDLAAFTYKLLYRPTHRQLIQHQQQSGTMASAALSQAKEIPLMLPITVARQSPHTATSRTLASRHQFFFFLRLSTGYHFWPLHCQHHFF